MRAHLWIAIVTGLVVASCGGRASDESPPSVVFVRQMQQPILPDCNTKADPAGTTIDIPMLDVALTTRYLASFLVGNTSFAASDQSKAAGSEKIFQARSAQVTIAQDGVARAPYTVTATGTVDPGGRDPGFGLVPVELIPTSVGAAWLAGLDDGARLRVEIRVRIAGTTLDGRAIETPEYVFPMDVCRACSVVYPPEAWDKTMSSDLNCLAPLATGSITASTTCIPGQDGVVDCRTCLDRSICHPCTEDGACRSFGGVCASSRHCK